MATKTQPVPEGTETTRQESASKVLMAPEERHRRVAEAAYRKAEKRGFVPGHELEDWLEAEKEIEALPDYWTLP